jgi:hypothetical protein
MQEAKEPSWTAAEIERSSVIISSDVLRALALIDEAAPELGEMVRAEEQQP